jgi:hypothetical protein
MGVPVINADGVMLVGFNQLKMEVALKIQK